MKKVIKYSDNHMQTLIIGTKLFKFWVFIVRDWGNIICILELSSFYHIFKRLPLVSNYPSRRSNNENLKNVSDIYSNQIVRF